MNILYSAMGSSLQMFLGMHRVLMEKYGLPRPSFFVSNANNYFAALNEYPELDGFASLFEWEIVNRGKVRTPDRAALDGYEKRFGPLWNAILADRRLVFGRLTKVKQDYTTPLSHEQLMGIIQELLEQLLAFIDKVRPNVMVSFSPVTAADYLFEKVAENLNIPFFSLRSTKIENYISFVDSAIDIPKTLSQRFSSDTPFAEELRIRAEATIAKSRSQGMAYEGVMPYGAEYFLKRLKKAPRTLYGALKTAMRYRCTPILRTDNHLPPPVRSAVYQAVVQPLRCALVLKTVNHISQERLEAIGPYAFYPMHFEPEMAVQVLGRGYQNQIEVIRNLALSVPIGMKVVVKEHPRSLGVRPTAYYRKLLAIPNVVLVHPFTPAVAIIRHASLIAIISGAIGFESLVAEKPVIVFGTTPLTLLPNSMVRQANNPAKLADDIRLALEEYTYDYEALVRYICANLEGSIPMNIYSVVLQKNLRVANLPPAELEKAKREQLEALAMHLLVSVCTQKGPTLR
jgi:UDP-N-acetylglucosamine 2-epimerase